MTLVAVSGRHRDQHMDRRGAAVQQLRALVESFDWTGITESRRRVLEAFLVVATRDGYASVTMRALGSAIDVTAPSLYKHFRGGRDEVVREALRWHYQRFASDVLEAVEGQNDPVAFWDALVGLHVRRQLTLPESDMFDLLVATDRVAAFLPDEGRTEVVRYLRVYAALFETAAQDMGRRGAVEQAVAMVMSVLDDVRDWSHWGQANQLPLEEVVRAATDASHALLNARTTSYLHQQRRAVLPSPRDEEPPTVPTLA